MNDESNDTTEDVLVEIMTMLRDYGDVLRRIDGRLNTMDASMELIRQNQATINKRESAMEQQFNERQNRMEEFLQTLARRVSALETDLTPIPRPYTGD